MHVYAPHACSDLVIQRRVLDVLELELLTTVGHHVGARNRTWFLC